MPLKMTVDKASMRRLKKRLESRIPEKARAAASKAMEKGAAELVAMMRRFVPIDGGALRDSIGWTWGSAPEGSISIGTVRGRKYGTMRITIYAGNGNTTVTGKNGIQFQKAVLQEFGTNDMPANPYFFVTWRALKSRVRSRITRATRKALKSK